jgi:hypothetical protein
MPSEVSSLTYVRSVLVRILLLSSTNVLSECFAVHFPFNIHTYVFLSPTLYVSYSWAFFLALLQYPLSYDLPHVLVLLHHESLSVLLSIIPMLILAEQDYLSLHPHRIPFMVSESPTFPDIY